MISFTSLLGFGVRRSCNKWLYTCKIARTSGFENIGSCVLVKHIHKTNLNLAGCATRSLTSGSLNNALIKNFGSFSVSQKRLFDPKPLLNLTIKEAEQRRSLVKFSKRKCKRKTVKAVIRRFYRLHWGAWIRTRAGKNKHIWRKSIKRRMRMKKHFFCNNTQSRLLDHMTTKFWKRRRYYIDDPYEPYHYRHAIYRGNMS